MDDRKNLYEHSKNVSSVCIVHSLQAHSMHATMFIPLWLRFVRARVSATNSDR